MKVVSFAHKKKKKKYYSIAVSSDLVNHHDISIVPSSSQYQKYTYKYPEIVDSVNKIYVIPFVNNDC